MQAGGYVSTTVGSAADANALTIQQAAAETAMKTASVATAVPAWPPQETIGNAVHGSDGGTT